MVVKVSVHQPSFLPWAGYWHKLLNSDVHIVLTGVDFDRAGYQHRVMLNGSWLTIPVKHGDNKIIRNVEIDRLKTKKLAMRLRQSFPRKANPCWYRVDDIADMIADPPHTLAELNIQLLNVMLDGMKVPSPRVLVDDKPTDVSLSKTRRLFSRFASYELGDGPIEYLTGGGGMGYTDPDDVPPNVTLKKQVMGKLVTGETALHLIAKSPCAGEELLRCGTFEDVI